jgi:hypothetical protein
MLWERVCDGTWKLRRQGMKRLAVEREVTRIPKEVAWRLVSQYDGLLAESLARDPGATTAAFSGAHRAA